MRGEGRAFQRGSIWWFAYWGPHKGKWQEIRESSGSEKESDARKKLRDRVREVANHRGNIRPFAGPTQARLTVGNLLDSLQADYERRAIKSLRTALIHIKPVREFFGHICAISVTADLVLAYIATRQSAGRSPSTINRETEMVGRAFGLALQQERLSRKPYILSLPENNTRQNFLEADQLERILPHLPAPMDAIARFGFISGWRRSECRLLRWQDVDHSAREVALATSKNNDPRRLPLDPESWQIFQGAWALRQYDTPGGPALSEYVFHTNGKPVGDSNFTHRWARARKAAGLPGVFFHDMRRGAARHLLRSGTPQVTVMRICGWRTDSLFRRYAITTSDDMREAMQRQREYLNAQPKKNNVAEFRASAAESDSDISRTKGNGR